MKKFVFEQGDMYLSREVLEERMSERSKPESWFTRALSTFFDNRPEHKEFIELHGKLNNLKRYAFLCAHGDVKGRDYIGDWVYEDDGEELLVQDCINRFDGLYSGLLIKMCNPGSCTPKIPEKSVLMIPDRTFRSIGCEASFSLIAPKLGEIDSYVMDYEINKLHSQIKKKAL